MPGTPPPTPRESEFDCTALVIAHPGHELRVHGWLETARPVSFVLTKGDGHAGASRLGSTTQVLDAAGATKGSIYGRLDDTEMYAALIRRDEDLFLGLLDELAEAMTSLNVRTVVADAEEGYNPSHDVCTYLALAASAIAARSTGRTVRVFDFPLIGAPGACPPELSQASIWLRLDDEAFTRKLQTAHNYPEMAGEVTRALEASGADAFRVECLRPATVAPERRTQPPFYEQYGQRQVAAGLYRDVIRYDQHVAPVKHALWSRAGLCQ
jgi:AcrR family transcriptional regulator